MSRAPALSRNNTKADDLPRAFEGGRPRLYDRPRPAPAPDDLAAQHAIREARVIPCAPNDCHYHRGPMNAPCQRCGADFAHYSGGPSPAAKKGKM